MKTVIIIVLVGLSLGALFLMTLGGMVFSEISSDLKSKKKSKCCGGN